MASPNTVDGRSTSDFRILVVDDNPLSRSATTRVLVGLGLNVTEASGGRMAVTMCGTPGTRFGLVLMDLVMPDIDGLEATAQIRELSEAVDLPIVGWSSRSDARAKEAALAAGMVDLQRRRYDEAVLRSIVERWASV